MTFTKTHYETVAREFNERVEHCVEGETFAVLLSLANSLAQIFQADNPRFDRDKFLRACGVIE